MRKIALWIVLGLAFLSAVALLPALRSVIIILVVALFLSLILDPIVSFFENQGVSRGLASILVFAMIVFIGILGFKFLAPVVSNEIQELSSGIDDEASGNFLQRIQKRLGEIPVISNPMIQTEIKQKVDDILRRSLTMVADVLSAVVSMIMLAFITFFFLKDGRRMKKKVISWVPNRYFEMSLIIQHKISAQLGRYIRGQLLVALIVGSLSIFALYLLEIRYYFFIGALAGLANMIPYFGPLVGALPAMVIAHSII